MAYKHSSAVPSHVTLQGNKVHVHSNNHSLIQPEFNKKIIFKLRPTLLEWIFIPLSQKYPPIIRI